MMKFSRRGLKTLVFGGIGGGIGVLTIVFAVALYVVETLIRPRKKGIFDDYTFTPYELDLPAEAVVFPPLKGEHEVSGWFIPRLGATTTILVCPGYRSRKSDALGMSALLWKAGHNVLVFEYYGHGAVVGKPVTLGFREINDFMGAVTYAKQRTPQAHLGVVAYSMGAAVALMCASQDSSLEAIVADSAFATHRSVIHYNLYRVFRVPPVLFIWIADYLLWLRAGYRFHQVEPLRHIDKIAPRPLLLIQGGKDSIVDPKDVLLLFEAASEPKELWYVPEAEHCGAYFEDREAYGKKIIAFFESNLLNKQHLQLIEASEPAEEDGTLDNYSAAS